MYEFFLLQAALSQQGKKKADDKLGNLEKISKFAFEKPTNPFERSPSFMRPHSLH